MNDRNKIAIEIQYKLEDEKEWKAIELSPEEYFDLDEGEEASIDSVPIHNNTLDYISDSLEKVKSIKTTILDTKINTKRIFLETFWNHQQNQIIERIDSGNGLDYYEIIINTKIQEVPPRYEVIRAVRKEGVLVPGYHAFFTENPDGSETETRIIG